MPARRFERLCLTNDGNFCTSNSGAVWESSFIVSLLGAVYCFETVSLLPPLWEGLGTFIRDEKFSFSSFCATAFFYSMVLSCLELSVGGFGWIEKRSEKFFVSTFNPQLQLMGWRLFVVVFFCCIATFTLFTYRFIDTLRHTYTHTRIIFCKIRLLACLETEIKNNKRNSNPFSWPSGSKRRLIILQFSSFVFCNICWTLFFG